MNGTGKLHVVYNHTVSSHSSINMFALLYVHTLQSANERTTVVSAYTHNSTASGTGATDTGGERILLYTPDGIEANRVKRYGHVLNTTGINHVPQCERYSYSYVMKYIRSLVDRSIFLLKLNY